MKMLTKFPISQIPKHINLEFSIIFKNISKIIYLNKNNIQITPNEKNLSKSLWNNVLLQAYCMCSPTLWGPLGH